MKSPLSVHQDLLRGYQEYLGKQFKSRDEAVTDGRMGLYRKKGVTFQPPFLELLFNYKLSGVNFRDPGSLNELDVFFGSQAAAEDFRTFCSAGIMGYEAFSHQWDMLKATLSGKNSIITTGTGSGKTESFMLPLIAYLLKDIGESGPVTYNIRQYYTKQHNGVFKRRGTLGGPRSGESGTNRKAAVRAIMLYPMNALVEDQLKRIRQAFSRPEVLRILNERYKGNRIFYGKYTGMTEGTGPNNDDSRKRLENFYKKIAENEYLIKEYASTIDPNKRYSDALDYFGREITEAGDSLTGEMLNRFDMQDSPPDLLITNLSMLNIMLTRTLEQGIWDKTKEWLKEDGSIFHIILDEMHLYRGTAGTEVAYTVSALLERLGIADNPEKVRFLASSASLDRGQDAMGVDRYISRFFNVPEANVYNRFHIETGEQIYPIDPNGCSMDEVKACLLDIHADPGSVDDELLSKVSGSSFVVGVCDWYRNENGNRPCSLEELGRIILNRLGYDDVVEEELANLSSAEPEETEAYCIVNGFFLFRELLDSSSIDHNLPRIRLHLMYNNFEGLWASLSATDDNRLKINATYNHPKKIDEHRNKVYQLFYCEQCESSFVGGYRDPGTHWELDQDAGPGVQAAYVRRITPTEANLSSESQPVVSLDVNKLKYGNYTIFWPENQSTGCVYVPHTPETLQRDRISEKELAYQNQRYIPKGVNNGYWVMAFFDPKTGRISVPVSRKSPCPQGFIIGRVYMSFKRGAGLAEPNDIYRKNGAFTIGFADLMQNQDSESDLSASALSQCCPSCATKKTLSPVIRGYRTGFNKTNQIFASTLYKSLKKYSQKIPGDGLPHERTKLVSFSDSRDEAAQVSAGVQAEHFNELVIDYILSRLSKTFYDQGERLSILTTTASRLQFPTAGLDITELCSRFDEIIETVTEDLVVPTLMIIIANFNIPGALAIQLITLFNEYRDGLRIPACYRPDEFVGTFTHGAPFSGLHAHLIGLGVDPRGVYNVKDHILLVNGQTRKWHQPIIKQNGLRFQGDDTNIQSLYTVGRDRNSTITFFKSIILGLMFQPNQYSIEHMGLGRLIPLWPSPAGFPDGHWESFSYGLVKIMGWKGHYRPRILDRKKGVFEMRNYPIRANLPDYIVQYVNDFNQSNATNVENATVLSIFANKAVVMDFTDTNCPVGLAPSSLEDIFYRCNRCYEVYSQKTAFCLGCGLPFGPLGVGYTHMTRNDLCSRSYPASHISKFKERHTLHCEELSGQTDDPYQRQRNFLGLIKDEQLSKLAQEIDLLSVTTTLEVGVDIGSLQGLLMANMPPQRFNYQQRVGRVGRRRQAFSFAVTLCRSKSHDAHYFQHPESITGDPSPTPFLNTKQRQVIERAMNKFFLAYFFRELKEYLVLVCPNGEWRKIFESETRDTNGEFGTLGMLLPDPYPDEDGRQVGNPSSYDQYLDGFLIDRRDLLIDHFSSLQLALGREDSDFSDQYDVYLNSLLSSLREIASDRSRFTGSEYLAQVLMELGFLPSYGMPSRVSLFYNEYPLDPVADFQGVNAVPNSMDRMIDVAIFDYTPGTTKLKDKVEYTVRAIVPDVRQTNHRGYPSNYWEAEGSNVRSEMAVLICVTPGCRNFQLVPHADLPLAHPRECPNCRQQSLDFNGIKAIEPRNFSVLPPVDDQQELEKGFSSNNKLAVSGLGSIDWTIDPPFRNICLAYKEPDPSCHIFKINRGSKEYIPLSDGVILTGNRGRVNGLVLRDQPRAGKYWLYTRKNTESLSFIVSSILNGSFDLSIGNDATRNMSKKAVFLSAASILQRCFADIMDIDPREVEFTIPEPTTVDVAGTTYATYQLNFFDSHDNGSGYVKEIREKMSRHASLTAFVSTSKFFNMLSGDDHKDTCSSGSCYKCIRTYDNSMLHGLLDWRLGMDLIAFMGDPDFRIDFGSLSQYVLNMSSGYGYEAEVVDDPNGNSAILISIGGVPHCIVTHPVTKFDVNYYRVVNGLESLGEMDVYGWALTS